MWIRSRVSLFNLFLFLYFDLGFGSVHLRAETFLFPLSLTQLGLGLGSVRFFSLQIRKEVFSSVLFFFPELSARVRVRVLDIPLPLTFL